MLPTAATQTSVHSSPGFSCQGTDAWVHWGPANLHFGASLGEEAPLRVDKSTRPPVWCRLAWNVSLYTAGCGPVPAGWPAGRSPG